jgi:CD109 antigen
MIIFNSTPLYVLDICEVCGSYQCPYCPYFSGSPVSAKFSSPLCVILCCLLANALYSSFTAIGLFEPN